MCFSGVKAFQEEEIPVQNPNVGDVYNVVGSCDWSRQTRRNRKEMGSER